jgi:hypothetical protein
MEKGNLKERVIRKVLLGLEEGKTINNLAGNVGDGYVRGTKIVNAARLNNFCDANPKLGKRIRALAEKNRIAAHKKNGERARLVWSLTVAGSQMREQEHRSQNAPEDKL